jgi:two-component system sensor histidine kinase BaeS
MEDLDVAELVRDCLDANAGRFAQRPLAVEAVLPAGPVIVQGDPRRLRQLVENLIENSLRYTDPGGRLRVTLAVERDRIEVRLDDSAPGVPDDLRDTMFEPFVRGDGARSRASGGSGLGLAICRRIVDAHGGTIAATSSPLGGVGLVVRLPSLRARNL